MPLKQPFRFEFIRKLCAHLTEEELVEAERRFAAYLDVVAEIVERRAKGDSTEPPTAPHTSEVQSKNL